MVKPRESNACLRMRKLGHISSGNIKVAGYHQVGASRPMYFQKGSVKLFLCNIRKFSAFSFETDFSWLLAGQSARARALNMLNVARLGWLP